QSKFQRAPSHEGKMSTTRTFVCSVNTFPEKSFGKNKRRLQPLRRAFFRSTRVIWRRVLKEGRTENANSRTGLKPFLQKVLRIKFFCCQTTVCEISGRQSPPGFLRAGLPCFLYP